MGIQQDAVGVDLAHTFSLLMICRTSSSRVPASTCQPPGAVFSQGDEAFPARMSSSSRTPQATRLMLMRSRGPMLLELEEPPTAPQPRAVSYTHLIGRQDVCGELCGDALTNAPFSA